MRRARTNLASLAVLALALFAAWLGAGIAHQHGPAPSCQICKAVHGSAADLAVPGEARSPRLTDERVVLNFPEIRAARPIEASRGRAPPTA